MGFYYSENELVVDGASLNDLAREYGTPLYVYSESLIHSNAELLQNSFGRRGFSIAYAMKANSNPAILKIIRDYGFGLDIVSGGELQLALRCGFEPGKINFAGVGKTEAEIRAGVTAGIGQFNVESQFELEMLQRIAAQQGSQVSVFLRLNPNIDPATHPHISTGLKENKFGMDAEVVEQLFLASNSYPDLNFEGIHCHIGSQIMEGHPFIQLVDYLKMFTTRLGEKGVMIKALDLGGGFGVDYMAPLAHVSAANPYLDEYAKYASSQLQGMDLYIEPGRILTANAGVILSRVLGLKTNGTKHFIVLDSATTEIIRPALYDAFHAILSTSEDRPKIVADVVGPVCESSDALARDRELDAMQADDLAVICSAGAYSSSMSSTYNLRPLAAELMVDSQGQAKIVRRRQSYSELLALYPDLPALT